MREAGLRHKLYATFMAKPMQGEPGSAMHIHQSDRRPEEVRPQLSSPSKQRQGHASLFHAHIAGLQKYLPAVMPLIAPNVNSYRRLIALLGRADQHPLGLRQPHGGPARAASRSRNARRVENRPRRRRRQPLSGDRRLAGLRLSGHDRGAGRPARRSRAAPTRLAHTLPRSLYDALDRFSGNQAP